MAKYKATTFILPALFILCLVLPTLSGIFGIWEFERKNENRTFNDSLSFDFNHLDNFPFEATSYVNDNFAFRTPFLNAYHEIKYSGFGISPYPDRTIIGSDNWFFLAGKEQAIYEGKKDFTVDEKDHLLSIWKRRKRYLDSLNIPLYWIVPPMKHHVYSEFLPFNIYPSDQRRVTNLKQHFQQDLQSLIIDPTEMLEGHKTERNLYYQLDNHWSYYSGYLTTKLFISKAKEQFPSLHFNDLAVVTWKDSVLKKGIHRAVLGIDELQETTHYPQIKNSTAKKVEKFGFPPIKGFPYPSAYEIRYKSKNTSNLKALIIRDSFGKQLLPFMSEVFSESVFIFDGWRYELNKKIVEEYKPDLVIFLTTEPLIGNFLLNHPPHEEKPYF